MFCVEDLRVLDGFGFQAVSATTIQKLEKPDESEGVRVVFQRQHRGLGVRAPTSARFPGLEGRTVEILSCKSQNPKVLCATTAR